TFSINQPPLPMNLNKIVSQPMGPMAPWAAAVSPFRADLAGNYAAMEALAALRPNQDRLSTADIESNDVSQRNLTQVLRIAPYHSELWLLLALLQTQRRSGDPRAIETLKMSYFTAPNDEQIMPLRIYAAATSDALSDPDLG